MLRSLTALAALILLVAACAGAPQQQPFACTPPLGADALWANPQTQYVVLGEHHGTTEMPATAAEIVCAAASDGASVLFAIELPESEQAALHSFIVGDLSRAAMLENSPFWNRSRDGRSSSAMLAMLERIRALRALGLQIAIVAVAPDMRLSDSEAQSLYNRFPLPPQVDREGSLYDLRMAASVIDGAANAQATRTIFLVGNAHAVIEASPSSSWNSETGEIRRFIRMHSAAAMPRETTVSLVFTHADGEAFAQTRAAAGVGQLHATERELAQPTLVLSPHPPDDPRYDGRIFVGSVTASPPVGTSND